MIEKKWSVQKIWNDQLSLDRDQKKPQIRERIWASEIGKNLYERWLKMKGISPDFDYDERILRKFAAGNFFERIIGYVLITSGLLKYDNKWYNILPDKDHLEVSVKPDFIAGGKPDWEKVEDDINKNRIFEIMPVLKNISKQLVENFSKDYPDGLHDIVYEIKSVNSLLFWSKKDKLSEAYPHHKMQLYTALKATGISEGRILYISKDDLTIAEFAIQLDTPHLEDEWEKDVKTMTIAIRNDIAPPKPENIIFDPEKKMAFNYDKKKYVHKGWWVPNWEIERSMYLPTITGCKDVKDWLKKSKIEASEKNLKIKEEIKTKINEKDKN